MLVLLFVLLTPLADLQAYVQQISSFESQLSKIADDCTKALETKKPSYIVTRLDSNIEGIAKIRDKMASLVPPEEFLEIHKLEMKAVENHLMFYRCSKSAIESNSDLDIAKAEEAQKRFMALKDQIKQKMDEVMKAIKGR